MATADDLATTGTPVDVSASAAPSTGQVLVATSATTAVWSAAPGSTAVQQSLFDANTILKADTDNTPTALVVGTETLVGRKSTGGITALTPDETAELLWANAKRFKSIPGNLIYYGGDPTGVGDSTTAVRAALAAIGNGEKFYVPPGTYRITERVRIDVAEYGKQIVGFAGGTASLEAGLCSVFLIDINDADEFAFDVRTYDVQFRNLLFKVLNSNASTPRLRGSVMLRTGDSGIATHMTLHQCAFLGGHHGWCIGYETPTANNQELCRAYECSFVDQITSGVIVGQIDSASANSIGHVFDKCFFYSSGGPTGQAPPYGTGLISDGGGPLWFRDCNFSGLERGIAVRGETTSSVKISNTDCENSKTFYDSSGFNQTYATPNAQCCVEITGGRFDLRLAGDDSNGPKVLTDNYFIIATQGMVILNNAVFARNGNAAPILLGGAYNTRVSVRGCTLPALVPDCFNIKGGNGSMTVTVDSSIWSDLSGIVSQEINGEYYFLNSAPALVRDHALLAHESESVASIAGSICTLDLDSEYGLDDTTTAVNFWTDSIRGNKALKIGAGPVIATDGSFGNSIPAVQCAVTGSKGLHIASAASPLAQPLIPKGKDYWSIMVCRRRSSPPAGSGRLFEWGFVIAVNQGLTDEAGGLKHRAQGSTQTSASSTAIHIVEQGLVNGSLHVYIDGVAIGSPMGSSLTTSIDVDYLSIGANGNAVDGANNLYCDLSIWKFNLFTRKPPVSALTRIRRLLQGKYGTPAVP